MVGPVQWVNKEEQPEAHHRQKMTEYRAARGCGDYVVSDGDSKRRHEEADGIMNPETAERCAPRAGNELRYKIPDRIGEHCEGDAADNVPSTDIQVGEPSFQEWQDKLEDHQNEGKDDESVYDERKLRPLQRLAETGDNQHPSREYHRKIPDPEEKPSEPAAQNRPICQAWHNIIKECQEGVAQPSEEYALRVVVAKPAPGKPSVASQKFWKGELGGHQNANRTEITKVTSDAKTWARTRSYSI